MRVSRLLLSIVAAGTFSMACSPSQTDTTPTEIKEPSKVVCKTKTSKRLVHGNWVEKTKTTCKTNQEWKEKPKERGCRLPKLKIIGDKSPFGK
jgi:hypothetical protein